MHKNKVDRLSIYGIMNIYIKRRTSNMSIKKLTSLVLAFLLVFFAVACNSQGSPEATTAGSAEATTLTPTTENSTTAAITTAQTPPPVEPEKIKNLIIIIGDGMGPIHITAGQHADGKTYQFTEWEDSRCNTDSVNAKGVEVLTDSAASATALATGTLTINGYLGKDPSKKDLTTIMDIAKDMGKSVGVVTSDQIYGATPSGFSAHSPDRGNSALITTTQLRSGVDFFCGLRNDKYYADYKISIKNNGYHYATDIKSKDEILKAEKAFLPLDIENGAKGEIPLKDAASLALEFLERDDDGFVLMIEQAYIDKYSHNNDINGMLERMTSIDQTVDTVRDWIGDRKDTAVIVTADHETGGLSASLTTQYKNKYTAGVNDFYYEWKTTGHTQTMVKIYVYGYDVDFKALSQYKRADAIKNTDVFKLMKQILEENK